MNEVICNSFEAKSLPDGRLQLRIDRCVVSPMIGVREVAEQLGVDPESIYRLCRRRKRPIPHSRVGAAYRFNRQQVLDWAASEGRGSINPHIPS